MSPPPQVRQSGAGSFKGRLTATIMVVVAVLTGLGLYLAQRHVAAEAQRSLRQDFEAQLQSLHELQDLRNRTLSDRCAVLVAKPRIHAALEDNALDLLYPSAKDELRDLIQPEDSNAEATGRVLHARFCRFLDEAGAVLPPPNPSDVGTLAPEAEAALNLPRLPRSQQIGYLPHPSASGQMIDEIVAAPIFSSETGEVIAALVVGFKPFQLPAGRQGSGLTSGVWVNGHLQISSITRETDQGVALQIGRAIATTGAPEGNCRAVIDGVPHLLFYKRINRESLYPAAYEICLYPLTGYSHWQRRLLWQIALGGLLLLVIGFIASRLIAQRLAAPVADLEAERTRAEAALELTSEELERTARYSADASHQLKSPVTILRAGLETLLKRESFDRDVYDELSNLLHQTYRLTGVIDDLLLLARMDAGHLKLEMEPVDLRELIAEWLDDLSAMPDASALTTQQNLPADLHIAGERRYTSLIVQNLLENARKYNRAGGKIEIAARKDNSSVVLSVGNTGRAIPKEAQHRLFARFQRGAHHQTVSGHGLGLNLARELARLHGGNLRLVRSENDWTEFEVLFRTAKPPVG